jgi:hypothetical protein
MKLAIGPVLAVCVVLGACSSNNKTNQPSASETPGGGSTAPSGQSAAGQKKALVRFAQTVAGKQSMDLWFGDMKVFSNVGYKQVTPYIEVPAERHDFKLQSAGDTQPSALATNSEGLTAGSHYTIVAERTNNNGNGNNANGNYTLKSMDDNLNEPNVGKAKLRVVNAAVGLGSIDVVDANGQIVGGVGEDSSTDYKEIAPLQGTLEVRRGSKKADVLRIQHQNIQPGKIYTLFIVGGAGQPLDSVLVSDQLTPPTGVGG